MRRRDFPSLLLSVASLPWPLLLLATGAGCHSAACQVLQVPWPSSFLLSGVGRCNHLILLSCLPALSPRGDVWRKTDLAVLN